MCMVCFWASDLGVMVNKHLKLNYSTADKWYSTQGSEGR
jgi:hypothetical protein